VPLLCFAAAARRIPLSAIGLMQYIGPSIQFMLGLFVYGEPFDAGKLVGFVLVWAALVIYAIDGLMPRAGHPAAQRGQKSMRVV
jgi:chloramphenicol-sensitive protein RarD